MKKSILLALLMSIGLSASAQWVTIPDANFANKLNELFPECMDGNQMNTECPGIVNATSLSVEYSGISDLSGLEYFVSLEYLNCSWNNLTTLPPYLPPSLLELQCNNNNLIQLPGLPQSLEELWCYNNSLTSLPSLPASLIVLACNGNNLTSLPELPESLDGLQSHDNNLTVLPELPQSLVWMFCWGNNLVALPELPQSLFWLYCGNNNLTELPELPQSLMALSCHNNQLTCLPTLPVSLEASGGIGPDPGAPFNISNNPFTCLPNYVPAMNSPLHSEWLSFPLCDLGDLDNNPFGCSSFAGIGGTVFEDSNANCEEDGIESGVINAIIKLLGADDELLATTFTLGSSDHAFFNLVADTGDYSVQLVAENMPFQVSCDDPGDVQEVELTADEPYALNVNFGVECLPGFDVGVQSAVPIGWVFPGQVHTLKIAAGDMTNWYGLQCAQGVGGNVTIYVDGPVSYVGPANNALTPAVTGELQFTYSIADFGAVNFQQDFALMLETDTTAQAGESVCVDIIVDPIVDDLNPANNTFNHCYTVVNSYDPNIKEVWPHDVEPGFDDYFNFTIYFQNTGTAPAFNIRLADTLDTNLDLNTFEVTGYSHPVLTYLHGNVLTFRFNNIMLPDSTTDLEGSIGYVQYRIKAVEGLPVGTIIENTAHIFFDFNEAIVTNTTQNEFVIITSVTEQAKQQLLVFPNPGTGLYNVSLHSASASISTIEVFSITGVRVTQQPLDSQQTVLDLTHQPPGMYLLRVQNELGSEIVKVVKH